MNQQDNSAFNGQTDRSKQTSSNQNQVVWDGGSYSDKPTTEADVQKNDDLEFGDHGTTTMNPTNDATDSSIDDDDEDFDDNVGGQPAR